MTDTLAWRESARCTGLTAHFFPQPGQDPHYALSLCGQCPVRVDCLNYALGLPEDPIGVWGGTTGSRRRRLRADYRPLGSRETADLDDLADILTRAHRALDERGVA